MPRPPQSNFWFARSLFGLYLDDTIYQYNILYYKIMLMWLAVIILAYLFFGLGSFFDKLVLAGKPQPNSYIFYAGITGLVMLVLIPFANFGLLSPQGFMWVVLDAIVRVAGIYAMYKALEKFEVSRVIATIGATQPIFIFILTLIFFGQQIMSLAYLFAFLLLLLGSIIISIEKNHELTANYLKITMFSSAMFSLDYIFSKFVFSNAGFLQGVVWISIFIALLVSLFLIPQKSRREIFARRMVSNKKTQVSFFCAQASGGLANFLQGFAIFLAPVALLPVVNSLRGIQYVFLFFITLFFSYFSPRVLKEEISKRIIFQKTISIIFIAVGLVMLVV